MSLTLTVSSLSLFFFCRPFPGCLYALCGHTNSTPGGSVQRAAPQKQRSLHKLWCENIFLKLGCHSVVAINPMARRELFYTS